MFHSQYDTQHAPPKTSQRVRSRFSNVAQAHGRAPVKGHATSRSSMHQVEVTNTKQRPSISQTSYSEPQAPQRRPKPVVNPRRRIKEKHISKQVIRMTKETRKSVADNVPNKYSTHEIPVAIRKVKPVPVPVMKPTIQAKSAATEARTQKDVVHIAKQVNANRPAKTTGQAEVVPNEQPAAEAGTATEAAAEGTFGNAASESAANTEETMNAEVTLDLGLLLGDPSIANNAPHEHGTNDHSHSTSEHTHITAGGSEQAQATAGTQERTPPLQTSSGKPGSGTTKTQARQDTRSKKSSVGRQSNPLINIPGNVQPDKFEGTISVIIYFVFM